MIEKNAEKLLQVVDEFIKLDSGMPLTRVKLFLYIAKHETTNSGGVLARDLVDVFKRPQAMIWNDTALLGSVNGLKKKGAGLLETAPDTIDPRRNKIYLTPKGREFFKIINEIIGEDSGKVFESLEGGGK